MDTTTKALSRFGGAALVASGFLFLARFLLDFAAGPPPSTGAAILAWSAAGRGPLALANESLFFATVFLVPAVTALYASLADLDRVKALTGCGIIASVIPLLAMLDVVHGRLVFPVYGLRVTTPEAAALVVGIFYAGLHAVDLLLAAAIFILSLPMRHGIYGRAIAYLGFAAASGRVIASYPWAIRPSVAIACQLLFTAWCVAVGATLCRRT